MYQGLSVAAWQAIRYRWRLTGPRWCSDSGPQRSGQTRALLSLTSVRVLWLSAERRALSVQGRRGFLIFWQNRNVLGWREAPCLRNGWVFFLLSSSSSGRFKGGGQMPSHLILLKDLWPNSPPAIELLTFNGQALKLHPMAACVNITVLSND